MAQDSGCSLNSDKADFDSVRRRDAEQAEKERQEARQRDLEKALNRAGIPERFAGKTFATYQNLGTSQKVARSTCELYADQFRAMKGNGVCMILTGSPGTGKTHLAVSVLRNVIDSGNTGLFVSVSEMLRKIRNTYAKGSKQTEEEAFSMFVKPTLLVLDEVGVAIGDEEKRKAMVFDVLNARYNALRPTIIIGNLTVEEMQSYLGERVWDRLMEGGSPVVAFTGESYRQRAPVKEAG
ncbi:MAG: ATP-binding protein [gamma proteobacterium symbiont of Ctena orbiculata]|nr:MAG: ATP-binding protein [gamma proteobacterium symbiont of Ctena orbiculata]